MGKNDDIVKIRPTAIARGDSAMASGVVPLVRQPAAATGVVPVAKSAAQQAKGGKPVGSVQPPAAPAKTAAPKLKP